MPTRSLTGAPYRRSEQAAELPRQQRLQEQARHLHHADVDLIATAEDSARSAVPLPQRIAGSQRGYGSRGGYGTGDRMNAYTSRNPAVGIDRTVKVAATSDMDKDDSRFREINTYATTVVSDIDAHGDSPVEAQTEPTGTSNNSGEAAGSETAVSKKRKRSNSAAAGGGDGEGSGGANTVYDDGNVGEATLPELFGRAAVLDPEEAAVPLRVQARAFLAMLRGEQGRDEEGTGGDENRRSAGAGAGQAGYAALLARGTTAERKAMSATVQNASRATIYSGNSFAWATRYLVKHIYECKYKYVLCSLLVGCVDWVSFPCEWNCCHPMMNVVLYLTGTTRAACLESRVRQRRRICNICAPRACLRRCEICCRTFGQQYEVRMLYVMRPTPDEP